MSHYTEILLRDYEHIDYNEIHSLIIWSEILGEQEASKAIDLGVLVQLENERIESCLDY